MDITFEFPAEMSGSIFSSVRIKCDQDGATAKASVFTAFDASSRGDSPSIGTIPEASLAEHLLSRHELAQRRILDSLKLEGVIEPAFGIKDPFLPPGNSHPGDIDALLIPEDVRDTVAVEVKRIKVTTLPDGTDKLNKLGRIAHGAAQARDLAAIGFPSTWYLLACVVDAAESPSANLLCRGATRSTLDTISETLRACRDDLRDVGVLFLQLVQPARREISSEGSIFTAILKPPVAVECRSRMRELLVSTRARLRRI